MIQFMINSFIIINSLLFTQMSHPLAMGLTLLFQTVLITLMTGLMMKSFWFSYILFLIFMGGMLVLFIYVTSLASNEMFHISSSTLMLSTLFMITLLSLMSVTDINFFNLIVNSEMEKINLLNTFLKENIMNLNKLYNYPTNYITILMINYLLIALVAIVKITNFNMGSLRSMNN